jgi:hypothetical protein
MTRGVPNVTGYDFVPLPSRVRREQRPHARFDRKVDGCLFGRIDLAYELHEPVHVGSGFKRLVDGKPMRGMVRRGDQLVIPGSTMKGALRARFEAMTASCTCNQGPPEKRGRQRMSNLSRSHPQAGEAVLGQQALNHDAFRDRDGGCQLAAMCPACALFGFQAGRAALRSRVSVTDFLPATPVPGATAALSPQFAPRLHHCGEFRADGTTLLVTSVYGRKFHFGRGPDAPGARQVVEVLPAGTKVDGTLRFFNALPAELGGLLAAVGFAPRTVLRVGAGKGHGMGELRLRGMGLELRDHAGRKVETPMEEFTRAFQQDLDHWRNGEEAIERFFERK